jgi:hypothetical protein
MPGQLSGLGFSNHNVRLRIGQENNFQQKLTSLLSAVAISAKCRKSVSSFAVLGALFSQKQSST